MKRLTIMAPLALVLVCGCATQGRIRILNLDFRKPEQIKNGIEEAQAPFKDWSACSTNAPAAPAATQTEALAANWYTALMDMIAKLEARLCLLEIEWTGYGNKQPK